MVTDNPCLHLSAALKYTLLLMTLLTTMMTPRVAAKFSGLFAVGRSRVGGRYQAVALQLLAVSRPTDPATLSPLFGRPLLNVIRAVNTTNHDQNITVGKDPDGDQNEKAKNVCESEAPPISTPHGKGHDDSLHGAVHQVEHRASEKGGIEISRKIAEEAVKMLKRRTALERGVERAAERMGERATERMGERALEHAAEISAERVGERVGERAAERATERIGERAAERMGERVGERAAERMGERAAGRVGERAMEHGIAKGVARPLSLTIPERVALRIGRGVLIALPALGGIFALYLLKMDKNRAMLERKRGSRFTFMLFGGAAVTDAVDAVCHFAIAYGVFHEFGHHLLAQLEEVSLGCAFFSTLCAVMGEVMVSRKRKKLTMGEKSGTQNRSPPLN